jgi:hypothetical protein
MPVWLWYCFKARSFWFFTPSNPTLTFGGFEGERKMEMYDQLPPGSYPRSLFISCSLKTEMLDKIIYENEFTFPFAVKPDVGMMGFMFRKIKNHTDLYYYHKQIQADYIIQELIVYPLEVSVFYYRFPGSLSGTITGFLKKEFLQVTGDGNSTLKTLINDYDRVRFSRDEMYSKHAEHLHQVIPDGEVYFLSYALNLSRGGKLVSLSHEIDGRLLKIFDTISLYTKHFYYGRYDIKCASVEDLKQGKNFSILEFNGCGAEPHHAYGNNNNLFQAYRIFLHHWKILYMISRYNHRHGSRQWKLFKGMHYLHAAKKHFKKLKQLDRQTAVY